MRTGDWRVMREEAAILVELLRAMDPRDPKAMDVVERAQELQALGYEARELLDCTQGGTKH